MGVGHAAVSEEDREADRPRWFRRDAAPIDHALHVIGVGTVAWGAAVAAASHPGGLWAGMLIFILGGLIPIAILNIEMFKKLNDNRLEKLKEEVDGLKEEVDGLKARVESLEDIVRRNNLT